ncbi:J domain-containing protein [Myxococcus dinghuensis]|uniref:J domain-containing protein n=1 Tax=Myxococcus dinghuensis TaxID=2906761 RepID=UPI0020A74B33|nr:J domain-containing protein [Myxococcus dinghuensis]
MQFVLFFSDKNVREQLFARVDGTRGLLLVAGVRHGPAMRSPEQREPFVTLEFLHGSVLTQVLVADEGTAEGMWRDPLGDLADRLYPDSKEDAYAMTNGYLLLEDGAPRAVVRKQGLPAEDLWFLEEALSRLTPRVPPPDPTRRPGKRKPEPAPRAPRRPASHGAPRPPREPDWRDRTEPQGRGRVEDSQGPGDWRDRTEPQGWGRVGGEAEDPETTPPRGTRVAASAPRKDAWTLLGIARGTALDEARKAFRTLISGYHPDKVAHLAPEFRELAERRTREILEAWEEVERELKDAG